MKFFKTSATAMMMMHGSVWADESLAEFKAIQKGKAEKHGHYYHDHCAEVCYKTKSCRLDKDSQGSYCKKDHYPSTCFGLYHTRHPFHHDGKHGKDHDDKDGKEHHLRHKYCYEPNDPRCPVCFQMPIACNFVGTIPSSLPRTLAS